jgi:hypothetical protein
MRKPSRNWLSGLLIADKAPDGLPLWQVMVTDKSSQLCGTKLPVATTSGDKTLATEMVVTFLVCPFGEKQELQAIEVQPAVLEEEVAEIEPAIEASISFIVSKEKNNYFVDISIITDSDAAAKWLHDIAPSRTFLWLQVFRPDVEEQAALEKLKSVIRDNRHAGASVAIVLEMILAKMFEAGIVQDRKIRTIFH